VPCGLGAVEFFFSFGLFESGTKEWLTGWFPSFLPWSYFPSFPPSFYLSPFLSFSHFKVFLNTTNVTDITPMLKTKKFMRNPIL